MFFWCVSCCFSLSSVKFYLSLFLYVLQYNNEHKKMEICTLLIYQNDVWVIYWIDIFLSFWVIFGNDWFFTISNSYTHFLAVFLCYSDMLLEPRILKSDITQRVSVTTIFFSFQTKLWNDCLLWWNKIKGGVNKLMIGKDGGGGEEVINRNWINEIKLSRTLWEFSSAPKTCKFEKKCVRKRYKKIA